MDNSTYKLLPRDTTTGYRECPDCNEMKVVAHYSSTNIEIFIAICRNCNWATTIPFDWERFKFEYRSDTKEEGK